MPLHTLLLVLAIAAAAPVTAEATYHIGIPIVVREILLGVAIGPHGLGTGDWCGTDIGSISDNCDAIDGCARRPQSQDR